MAVMRPSMAMKAQPQTVPSMPSAVRALSASAPKSASQTTGASGPRVQ